jgi:DNA-binding HxlR family transcriptional regulator
MSSASARVGRWPTLPIYYLKDGTKRFSDLRRDNPTISHKMLTFELRKLEDAGIVQRAEFAGYPLRVEYDLTPAGHKLVPLIDALSDWCEARQEPGLHSESGATATSEPA